MSKILDNLFRLKNKKNSSGNSLKDEPVEKKKCQRCLRRIDLKYERCPYCGSPEFFD